MTMGVGWLLAIAMAMVVAAGCAQRTSDPVVDGWPIGPEADCDTSTVCDEWLAVARARLAVRDPGHAAVVESTLHTPGITVGPDGKVSVVTRSGGFAVARFELADGTVEAIGVVTPGISEIPVTVDFGP